MNATEKKVQISQSRRFTKSAIPVPFLVGLQSICTVLVEHFHFCDLNTKPQSWVEDSAMSPTLPLVSMWVPWRRWRWSRRLPLTDWESSQPPSFWPERWQDPEFWHCQTP